MWHKIHQKKTTINHDTWSKFANPQAPARPLPDPPPLPKKKQHHPPWLQRVEGNRSHYPVTSKGHLEAFAIQECQQHDTSKFTGNIASGPKSTPDVRLTRQFFGKTPVSKKHSEWLGHDLSNNKRLMTHDRWCPKIIQLRAVAVESNHIE